MDSIDRSMPSFQLLLIDRSVAGFGFQSLLYFLPSAFFHLLLCAFLLCSTMLSFPVSGRRSLGYVTAFPGELLGLHRQICARLPVPASRMERELVDFAFAGAQIRLPVGRLPLLPVFMMFAFFSSLSNVFFTNEI